MEFTVVLDLNLNPARQVTFGGAVVTVAIDRAWSAKLGSPVVRQRQVCGENAQQRHKG
jgi:hypothetical protein